MRPDCPFEHPGPVVWDTEPTWGPLIDVLGPDLVDTFMWMHQQTVSGGETAHAYKHRETRRYLYLTAGLRAFQRTPCGRLAPVRVDHAIEAALASWWVLGSISDAEATAIRAAMYRDWPEPDDARPTA